MASRTNTCASSLFVLDRIPLWVANYRGGTWIPEYRLHTLWFPSFIIAPVGVVIFGVGLKQHLHWGVLAFATMINAFGNLSMIGIGANYMFEYFKITRRRPH
ncbi:uncharacterized protein BDR25DRAFT_300157 [Lindgomyces ingoldianus]|uniref:Uncharacterized protein n=1 Tax=Lindgomyces ingoldianus TaxID=673940 RepID=A0ACB6RF24_9PLEO|nr:uncharacterized protein BDR25DRAFT_300157 [Lindgomyces ingoldianus]KAF2477081.1 hypothetical protein BDR25DRAFT_300157 [Lindgomyces ingoldianus]